MLYLRSCAGLHFSPMACPDGATPGLSVLPPGTGFLYTSPLLASVLASLLASVLVSLLASVMTSLLTFVVVLY